VGTSQGTAQRQLICSHRCTGHRMLVGHQQQHIPVSPRHQARSSRTKSAKMPTVLHVGCRAVETFRHLCSRSRLDWSRRPAGASSARGVCRLHPRLVSPGPPRPTVTDAEVIFSQLPVTCPAPVRWLQIPALIPSTLSRGRARRVPSGVSGGQQVSGVRLASVGLSGSASFSPMQREVLDRFCAKSLPTPR